MTLGWFDAPFGSSGGMYSPFYSAAPRMTQQQYYQLLRQQQEQEELERRQQLLEEQRRRQQYLLRQQQQQQQLQQQQRHGGEHHHHHRRAAMQRQQEQQAFLLQQQQEDEQREQQRHRAKRLRALQNRSVVRAVKTIQRHWRQYLERQRQLRQQEEEQRRNAAAKTITRALRAYPAIKQAKQITAALQQLALIRSKITAIGTQPSPAPAAKKELLRQQDQLERAILSLDSVATHGDQFVRAVRKDAVSVGQKYLQAIDAQLHALSSQEEEAKQQHLHAAARKVTAAVRNYPAIKQAKINAQSLKQTQALQKQLEEAKAHFHEQLEAIASRARQIPANPAISAEHAQLQREIAALLEAVPMPML